MPATPRAAHALRLICRHKRIFLLSLGFLSRLGPAMHATADEMRLACVYYPAVGAVIGAVSVLPILFDCFAEQVWIQAWLYVLLLSWLTRGLHLDGLADLADALGSAANGEAFYSVLKDSRTGAFGCAALIMALSGQLVLAAACLERGSLVPLVCAPVFGRCLPILLSCVAPRHPKASLGALPASAPRAPALLVAAVSLLTVLFRLPLSAAFLSLAQVFVCLMLLRRIALRQGGYNGDFCGFAVVVGEIALLLAASV
ncbi:MAG: adenosylcobinamide-GDP ribazoletransferase [Desulfovibrio sp.]|jgi:adenosylcobinamide-GDP ribazoletransferase|nr:adenosylcobinamide-GDP ribazoletransferase [Desulfovibrio sp.]